MPIITAPKRRSRKKPPSGIMMLMLLAVIFGFIIRNKWMEKKDSYIIIDNIQHEVVTPSIIELKFDLDNKSVRKGIESIMIKVYGENSDEIASKITDVYMIPETKKTYRKTVDKVFRPVEDGEKIKITVEVFKTSFFD